MHALELRNFGTNFQNGENAHGTTNSNKNLPSLLAENLRITTSTEVFDLTKELQGESREVRNKNKDNDLLIE